LFAEIQGVFNYESYHDKIFDVCTYGSVIRFIRQRFACLCRNARHGSVRKELR
jgi:hypothetical protein